jgi:signal transduction histidine kinase
MQALEAQRNEALAFISHDLRAPLAGAVSQLESGDACDQARLLPALRRALGMAQSFLWLARAEALDRKEMKEIELTSLMHQAVDEFHSLARQRQLPLVRQLPDEPVWIDGDFESLERSVVNLVHNALQHAPAGTAVTIGLDRAGDGGRRALGPQCWTGLACRPRG